MGDNGDVLTFAPQTLATLDEGSGKALGIGFGFFGLAAFFVILFLIAVWVGKIRDQRRGGPKPAPKLPMLGTPGDERDPKTRNR